MSASRGGTPDKTETVDAVDFEEMVPWQNVLREEPLPDNIIFPAELNRFLRNRIRDLTAENGCLRRSLEEAEEKLRRRADTGVPKMTLDKSSEMAAAKIVELSKKCRERTAELEVLKTKCKNLETELAKKQTELENEKKMSQPDQSPNSAGDGPAKEDEDRVKYLTEKLQQTQTKLYESKNTCATLRQEINKAQKLLSSEVGENVSIASLSCQAGGWRGRAEQIRLLQQKVSELQAKLSDHEGKLCGSTVSIDRKIQATLRNAEKERRQQIENSAKELRQAEVALETYRRKLDASKARVKVLENELNVARNNIAILNEKRFHDDHLIESLNSRLKSIEMRYQDREADVKHQGERMERECINLRNELQSAQLQIDRLRRKLEEREIEIDKLRNGTSLPQSSVDRIAAEKIIEQRDRNSETRFASPPQTFREVCEPNEYVTLALAAEAERGRLLELITVLNRRLDKERHDADLLSSSLREEKSKRMKLELRVRKLETERLSIAKVDTGYRAKLLSRSGRPNDQQFDADQARYKMELLEEECLALKTRLDTVQQDKATDLAMYKRMLDQARKIFQDACRNNPLPANGTRSTVTV